MLARAFRDNPLNRAVIGARPERRLRANLAGMRAQLPAALASGRVWGAFDAAALQAVLVAVPPFRHPLPLPPFRARMRLLFGQGPRVASRWAHAADLLMAQHELRPHWYLATLGVEPDAQGRGHGAALLRHFVAAVDAENALAYLETDRSQNLGFYRREGFEVEGALEVFGVPVWRMARPPRGPGGGQASGHGGRDVRTPQ